MNLNEQRRVTALAMAAVLLVAAVGTAAVCESEDTEVEAIPIPLILGVIIAIESAAIGLDWFLNHYGEDDGVQDSVVRGYEAQLVADSLINNVTLYGSAMANYGQIWSLTAEHHIRQAELAATELWGTDAEFDASEVLEYAAVYNNSAYMMINGASQVNAMFDLLSDSLAAWNGSETYADRMGLQVSWGSGSVSSTSSFDFFVGAAALDVAEGSADVYLTDEGVLWASAASTITSADGTTVTLSEGENVLSDVSGFSDGVWTLQAGVSYCGDMLPVVTSSAAPLYAGAVVSCGGDTALVTLQDGVPVVDGTAGNSLTVTINPDGAESRSADVLTVLEDYADLLDTVYWTMVRASSAAAAVWSIFDQAGHASAYLSTLMVPNNYQGMELTPAQQSLITVLALEQLASYWSESGGRLKTADYVMSDSMSLFVRGDIVSSSGEVLYEDAIFTPFFYQDTTLTVGAHSVSRQAIVAVWAVGAGNLSSWGGVTSASEAAVLTLSAGDGLVIYEMVNAGSPATSVDLSVTAIDIIDPGELVVTVLDPEPDNDLDKVVMLVLVLLGLLAVLSGWRSGGYAVMVLGVAMIAVGLLLSSSIADALEQWFGWRVELR